MFLEAQFGQSISPIAKPKMSNLVLDGNQPKSQTNGVKQKPTKEAAEELDEETMAQLEAAELSRLHSIGIPVPGIEIRVDKYVAKIWMESLEVESASPVFAQRVKAVVDRAVETVAPLWAEHKKCE